MTTTIKETPRIYVASLSDYNAGVLHGRWVDCDQDADDIYAEIQDMLAASPTAKRYPLEKAEEYAIHDQEGWHGLLVHEWANIEQLAELAEQLAEHGEAYAAYVANVGLKYATVEDFRDSYVGEYDSISDFAYDWLYEMSGLDVPSGLAGFIDYDAVWRELDCEGWWHHYTNEYTYYIFSQ